MVYADTKKNNPNHYFYSNNIVWLNKFHLATDRGTTDNSTARGRRRTARSLHHQVRGRHPGSHAQLHKGSLHACLDRDKLCFTVFSGAVSNLLLLSVSLLFALRTAPTPCDTYIVHVDIALTIHFRYKSCSPSGNITWQGISTWIKFGADPSWSTLWNQNVFFNGYMYPCAFLMKWQLC